MVAFKKILFSTDFTDGEKPALSCAIHLAGLHAGEVLVQHVISDDIEREIHGAVAHDFSEIQRHAKTAAEGELSRLLETLTENTSQARGMLSTGSVAQQISGLAKQEGVDLIVMGSARGSITREVIRSAACPVLAFAAPSMSDTAAQSWKIEGMLVAVDFSEQSANLVRYALDLRSVFDVPIHLLYVIETSRAIEFAITHGELAHTVDKMKQWALGRLQSLSVDIFAGDPGVTASVERGLASRKISEKAREIGPCLILIGVHRHGATRTHLLGTTTSRVLTTSENPVLTIKC